MTDTELTAEQWRKLGARFAQIQARMIHHEDIGLGGEEFYTEALRRLITDSGEGRDFVTRAYMDHVLAGNRFVDRANGERAQAQLKREREEYAAKLGTVRADIAAALRSRADRGQAGGKYRTEGVRLAAEWLDPQPATSAELTSAVAS